MMGPQEPSDNTLLYVHVDPEYPDAWTEPEIFGYLKDIIKRGGKIEMFVGEERFMLNV